MPGLLRIRIKSPAFMRAIRRCIVSCRSRIPSTIWLRWPSGVPVLQDCGSLDPSLASQTRVVEKRYKELGGDIRVILREAEGRFPLGPDDPKAAVDFILSHQR